MTTPTNCPGNRGTLATPLTISENEVDASGVEQAQNHNFNVHMRGFHIGIFPGRGNVERNRCMYALLHSLDFHKILDIFKDKKRQTT